MTTQVLNNFVRGKLDADLDGRFDLPIFSNGFEYCQNFLSNYKGNLKNRTGFRYEARLRGNQPAKLIEFRFNTEQAYLIEITDYKMRFYTYDSQGTFGYVTNSGGQILELNTDIPYRFAQYAQVAQNADALYLVGAGIHPKVIKRTSANSFSIENTNFSGVNYDEMGYPSTCCFYKGRLWLGGFSKKVTTLRASRVASYSDFTVTTSNIKDDDPLSFTLSDISDPIGWIYGGKNNLIVGNAEGISIVNGGSTDEPITATAVNADLANREGASIYTPTEKDSKMIYISNDVTRCYAFDYDLVSESFISQNLNLLNDSLGKIVEIKYKKDNNNLIYCRTGEGQLIGLLYNKDENIIGWFPMRTNGDIVSMCTVVRPDGKDDLFIAVLRDGNYYLERLTMEVEFTPYLDTDFANDTKKERFNLIQLEEAKNCVYLDGAVIINNRHTETITLYGDRLVCNDPVFNESYIGHRIVLRTKDGSQKGTMLVKNAISQTELEVDILSEVVTPATWDKWYVTTNVITGLEDVEGIYQSVVADGGYIGEFIVKNGRIELDKEYTNLVVGYRYSCLAKTFNLGGYSDGRNSQTMKKRINEFALRFVNSAGFMVGTDLAEMNKIQKFNPNGYYDTIPLLMNGDEFVYGYNDIHDKAKCIYLQQEEPLPLNLTMLEYKIQFEALE